MKAISVQALLTELQSFSFIKKRSFKSTITYCTQNKLGAPQQIEK